MRIGAPRAYRPAWTLRRGRWTIEISSQNLNRPILDIGWTDLGGGYIALTYGNGNSDPVLLLERRWFVPLRLKPHVDRYYDWRERAR